MNATNWKSESAQESRKYMGRQEVGQRRQDEVLYAALELLVVARVHKIRTLGGSQGYSILQGSKD